MLFTCKEKITNKFTVIPNYCRRGLLNIRHVAIWLIFLEGQLVKLLSLKILLHDNCYQPENVRNIGLVFRYNNIPYVHKIMLHGSKKIIDNRKVFYLWTEICNSANSYKLVKVLQDSVY